MLCVCCFLGGLACRGRWITTGKASEARLRSTPSTATWTTSTRESTRRWVLLPFSKPICVFICISISIYLSTYLYLYIYIYIYTWWMLRFDKNLYNNNSAKIWKALLAFLPYSSLKLATWIWPGVQIWMCLKHMCAAAKLIQMDIPASNCLYISNCMSKIKH